MATTITDPSSADVFAMAMGMEQTGHDFYTALGLAADAGLVRSFCHAAARDEARHLGIFRQMQQDSRFPTEQAQALQDLAKRMIQPLPEEVAEVAASGDVRDAIAMAIRMEEGAVFFYRQLEELFPAQAAALKAIGDEEQEHLAELRAMQL